MKQLEMAKWLKGLTLFTGAIGLVTLSMIVPVVIGEVFIGENESTVWVYLFNGFVWLTAVPVYIALYKIWKICGNIAINNSFCNANATYLKDISCLAIFDTALYLVTMIIGILFMQVNIIAILLLICGVGAGIFVAVATVALAHLTTKASAIKQENDLTI